MATTTTPGHTTVYDDGDYDDLTPFLMDLARRMDAEAPRSVTALVPVEKPVQRAEVVPVVATRVLPATPVRRSSNRAGQRVRFTLAVTGTVDPFSLGILLIAIAMLAIMVTG